MTSTMLSGDRGQRWMVTGEVGVIVSRTPDVTITRRDALPNSNVSKIR